MPINITKSKNDSEKITGITNLSLGLWEFYHRTSKKTLCVYVSDPVLVEEDDPYFRGVIYFSADGKMKKPLVRFNEWNTRVFTKSDKTITISN